jgi:alpha-mannosidase
VKKAEQSDEVIVRLVELDGKPQADVRLSFATPVTAAREVNGQEQPVGPATVAAGALVTSFSAYQPRTFALRLGPPAARVAEVRSAPVSLSYDVAAASNGGQHSDTGFDGKGNSLPAEMLPAEITFNDVRFKLAEAKTGSPNAVAAKGQSIDLPAGRFNRVYLLAASADGDQKVAFDTGGKQTELDIPDWGGFIGQWDDRQWSGANLDVDHAKYGDMTGLKQGYIKRADLAWYCDHHHDADGKNVTYRYSYLFGYAIDLPPGTKTIKLPQNDKIRILAMSVADDGPKATPVEPLYDVLPSPNAQPGGINYSGSLPAATIAATRAD